MPTPFCPITILAIWQVHILLPPVIRSANRETTTNPDYLDPSGRVEPEAYGFDIWEMQVIPPLAADGETQDYMSYNKNTPTWVSIYTWKAVARLLGHLIWMFSLSSFLI